MELSEPLMDFLIKLTSSASVGEFSKAEMLLQWP